MIMTHRMSYCFSTGVPRTSTARNLRVLPVISKGSAGLLVLRKKIKVRHLRSLDTFSRHLVGPKCICSLGCSPKPAGYRNLQRSPSPSSWWGGGSLLPLQEPLPTFGLQLRTSALWASAVSAKDMGSMHEESKLLKRFRFTEKV